MPDNDPKSDPVDEAPPPPSTDPWGDDEDSGNVADLPIVSVAPNPDNEPVLTARAAEGQIVHIPASKEQEYRDLGFELLTMSSDFGENGTLTVGADPVDVAFSNAQRKAAEKRLKAMGLA